MASPNSQVDPSLKPGSGRELCDWPRFLGVVLIALAIWPLRALVWAPPPKDWWFFLFFPAPYVLLLGASGLLLWFRRYRWLAKLWIGVFAIIMLLTLTGLPKMLGFELTVLDGDSPWPLFFAFTVFLTALWAAQRFVIVADEYADARWPKLKPGEPSNAADSR